MSKIQDHSKFYNLMFSHEIEERKLCKTSISTHKESDKMENKLF